MVQPWTIGSHWQTGRCEIFSASRRLCFGFFHETGFRRRLQILFQFGRAEFGLGNGLQSRQHRSVRLLQEPYGELVQESPDVFGSIVEYQRMHGLALCV